MGIQLWSMPLAVTLVLSFGYVESMEVETVKTFFQHMLPSMNLLGTLNLAGEKQSPNPTFEIQPPESANKRSIEKLSAPLDEITIKSGELKPLGGGQVIHLPTVYEWVSMQPNLQMFASLIQDVGMTFYLDQSRDMTVFIPTNKAMESLPFDIGTMEWETKWKIIQYHIIPSNILDFRGEREDAESTVFQTWEGSDLTVSNRDPPLSSKLGTPLLPFMDASQPNLYRVQINGIVSILSHSETQNGMCYVINRVLMPPTISAKELLQSQIQKLNHFMAVKRPMASIEVSSNSEPDQAAAMSKPQFLTGLNADHSMWNDRIFRRVPVRNDNLAIEDKNTKLEKGKPDIQNEESKEFIGELSTWDTASTDDQSMAALAMPSIIGFVPRSESNTQLEQALKTGRANASNSPQTNREGVLFQNTEIASNTVQSEDTAIDAPWRRIGESGVNFVIQEQGNGDMTDKSTDEESPFTLPTGVLPSDVLLMEHWNSLKSSTPRKVAFTAETVSFNVQRSEETIPNTPINQLHKTFKLG